MTSRRPPPPPPRHVPVSVTAAGREDRLPYFCLFPDEILSDPSFQALELDARGAVWTLLLYQWTGASDGLPADPAAVCRLIGLTPDRWVDVEDAVDSWFPVCGTRRANPRLVEQREQAAAKVRQSRDAAAKRWGARA